MISRAILRKILILSKFLASNFRIFLNIALFFIFFLFIFQAFQMNALTKEILMIENYQRRLNLLEQENAILQINSAQINSLRQVEKRMKELGFEKAERVRYIHLLESPVIAK